MFKERRRQDGSKRTVLSIKWFKTNVRSWKISLKFLEWVDFFEKHAKITRVEA